MGKYSPWEPTATLPSAGAAVGSAARSASATTEGGKGRGHIVAAARLQLVFLSLYFGLCSRLSWLNCQLPSAG